MLAGSHIRDANTIEHLCPRDPLKMRLNSFGSSSHPCVQNDRRNEDHGGTGNNIIIVKNLCESSFSFYRYSLYIMFSLVTGVYESYFASPQVNILVVGAQGAGKTTVLERLKVTTFRKRPPPPGIQQTAMPDELLRLIKGEDIDEMSCSERSKNSIEPDTETPSKARRESTFTSPNISEGMGTPTKARKRLAWVCPAPKRYQVQKDDDDEEVVGLINGNPPSLPDLDGPSAVPRVPPQPGPQRTHQSSVGSLDSVELPPTGSSISNKTRSVAANGVDRENSSEITPKQQQHHHQQQQQQQPAGEFDVNSKAKMISLVKIRPTIGMNLGKVDICQAKCHVWDLGGRLVDLWERYYADCDAVVFVWKLGKDVVPRDEDEDEEERAEITYELQQSLLNQVRGSIGDEIPFLILGHTFGEDKLCPIPVGPLYQTEYLLPHYHNPMQALMVANAATGQGIRAAMEWLVPLAKRQQAMREKSSEKLPT